MDTRISNIPVIGLGTYLQTDDEAATAVAHALKLGYRHIDTAEFYANQRGIAKGLKAANLAREEIFITDKLNPGGIFSLPAKTYQDTIDSLKKTLELLETPYVDLYLIHHPGAKDGRQDQWKALVEMQKQGLIKHIGVSNFSIKHLEELKAAGLPTPAVNQIEIHPLCTQTELVSYLRANNIVPIAYSSLAPATTWRVDPGQASSKTAEHSSHLETVNSMTAKYNITEVQLLLKWALQHNYPILPKSSKLERIEQNVQLFHFTIDDADMATLDGLDQNMALAWPNTNPLQWD